jgi:hypothetical protein
MADAPNPDQKLETVFDTADETEAAVVQGLLESAGIDSLVTSPDSPGEMLSGLGGVLLQVAFERAEEARHLIEEYRQRIVTIFRTTNRAEAEQMQSRLEAVEIAAILDEVPGRNVMTAEVRIPEADIEKARPILAEFGVILDAPQEDGSEPPQAASA